MFVLYCKIIAKPSFFQFSLGSISASSLAAVVSVGTHGTGYATGIIADYVTEIRLVVPSGDILVCSKTQSPDVFNSALCGLGALGIILELTLQCESKFYLHSLSYPNTLDRILANLDEHVESCDHFRMLWFPHTNYVSVSITNRIDGKFLPLSTVPNLSSNGDQRRLSGDQSNSSNDSLDSSFCMLDRSALINQYQVPLQLDSDKTWWQKAIDWAYNYGVGYHLLQFAYWVSTYIPQLVPWINRAAFWALYSSNKVSLDVSHKIFNFECLFDQYVNEWAIPR